jgi:hypothetical protein
MHPARWPTSRRRRMIAEGLDPRTENKKYQNRLPPSAKLRSAIADRRSRAMTKGISCTENRHRDDAAKTSVSVETSAPFFGRRMSPNLVVTMTIKQGRRLALPKEA